MISLPSALSPWAHLLGLFPEDLARVLAPWVQRIAAAVGPIGSSGPAAGDAVDGYDGITRKGDYDRLLISEWALAEALPEEFERRAAMNELAFLQRAFHGPRSVKRCIALFDSGPEQLGSPRIAHLATLIVLAARAEAAGAAFRWGVIQQSEEAWYTEVSRALAAALLESRTWVPPTATQVSRRIGELGSLDSADDVWVVAGPTLHAQFASTMDVSRITIDEPLAVEHRELNVEVRRRGHRAQLRLELPAEEVGIRLLRDPFESDAPVAKTTHRLPRCVSNVVISGDGRQLLYVTDRGALVAQHIPGSPRAQPAPPMIWRPPEGETVIAAGRGAYNRGRRRGSPIDVVTVHSGGVRVRSLGRRGGVRESSVFSRHAQSPELVAKPRHLGVIDRIPGVGSIERVLLFDGHSRVAELLPGGVYLADVEAEFFVSEFKWALAGRTRAGVLEVSLSEGSAWVPFRLRDIPGCALFVGAAPSESGMPGLWGHGPKYGPIELHSGQKSVTLQPPSGTTVVAVAPSALVLMERNQRAISLFGMQASEELIQMATPIESIATSATAPLLAIATKGGEIAIVDVARGRVMMRALTQAEEGA
ncbi:MAG: hypothetical protein WBV82_32380 [Myxococcaceae bacterium]